MVVRAGVQQKGFASSEWRGANGQTRRMPAGQEAPSARHSLCQSTDTTIEPIFPRWRNGINGSTLDQ